MFKKTLGTLAATAVAILSLGVPAGASHTNLLWKGQTWDISDNATAVVDGSGNAVITRTIGTSDAQLHVNRVAPLSTVNPTESAINDNGTPWIMYSYVDNGAHRGVDIFIDSEGAAPNPRLQAGSLFTCQGLGYVRYTAPPVMEDFAFAEGCDLDGSTSPIGDLRAAGQAHTIYVGQRADGTIDYNYDGKWFSSSYLKDAGVSPFVWRDVFLRLRGASGTTATFTDFQAGGNHPSSKSDCKSSITPPFKNQGDCVSFFSSGNKAN